MNNKLIADRPVMHTVSFADLQELNLVHGYEVSIDGQWYQIRMLMDLDEWLLALEAVGEDDHIWHWEQCQSFLQQPSGNGLRVLCTDSRRLDQPDMVMRTDRRQQTGWRPVLEPVFEDPKLLLPGTEVSIRFSSGELVIGNLQEVNNYDIVLSNSNGYGKEGSCRHIGDHVLCIDRNTIRELRRMRRYGDGGCSGLQKMSGSILPREDE